MAVQVSYPGVYIDEFAPGAPIQGVGTSTTAFVGLAASGPRGVPTLIQSWDAFVATFGGIQAGVADAWLAPAVYGFFQNGGTTAYVLRISSAAEATATLMDRGTTPAPCLVVTATKEGVVGNNVSVSIADSSRSDVALAKAMAREVTSVSGSRAVLTVASTADLAVGATATIRSGPHVGSGKIKALTATTVTLDTALAALTLPERWDGGTLTATGLTLRMAHDTVTTMTDRSHLTLATTTHGFGPGDPILVSKGGTDLPAVVQGVAGAAITLAAPLGGNVDVGGGTVRSADLAVGATRLRIVAPGTLPVGPTFPAGTLLAVTAGTAPTTQFVRVASSGGDVLQLDAPGLTTAISLDAPTSTPFVASAEFDLTLVDAADGTTKTFAGLSTDARHPRSWGTAVKATAAVVSAAPATATAPADSRPLVGTFTLGGGTPDDPAASWAQLNADPGDPLAQLASLHDISLVCVPGATGQNVQSAVVDHCQKLLDRFAILDAAPASSIAKVTDQFSWTRSEKGYAALYYPWIQVRNPANGRLEAWPPSGHVAGAFARTDASRGVHKAPANTGLRGAIGVEARLTDIDQGRLNLMGINVLRVFPGQGQPVIWGARTTSGDLDRNWQYVNVRRLFIFLEQSIEVGIRWAVFEPNDLSLWQRLKRTISAFLTQAWRDGALFGAKAEDAFYVRIDEELNPPASRALGRLTIEVGLQPTYPAEFIVLRIGIWDGGAEATQL